MQEPARLTGEAPASDHGCFPQCPRTESLQTPPRRVPSLPCRSSHSPSFPLGLLPLSLLSPPPLPLAPLPPPLIPPFPPPPPLTPHPLPPRSWPRSAPRGWQQVPSHLRAHRSTRASPAPRGGPARSLGYSLGTPAQGAQRGCFPDSAARICHSFIRQTSIKPHKEIPPIHLRRYQRMTGLKRGREGAFAPAGTRSVFLPPISFFVTAIQTLVILNRPGFKRSPLRLWH